MFMRIVRSTPKPGQHDEFAKRWKAFFGPRIEQNPKVRHAYVGYDATANAVVAVTVWDEHPGDAVFEATAEEFRPQVQDLMAGPPVFEAYEVIANA